MYYSAGITDPDYCVLKFTASEDRVYENFGSKAFSVEEKSDKIKFLHKE